jgi:hypothetical protein
MIIDYRKLNAITTADQYRPPRIDKCLEALGKARWFTSLDMRSGFYQLEVEASSQAKTASVTPT